MKTERLSSKKHNKLRVTPLTEIKPPAFEPPRHPEIHLNIRKMPRPQAREQRQKPSKGN